MRRGLTAPKSFGYFVVVTLAHKFTKDAAEER